MSDAAWQRDGYEISTERTRIDIDVVQRYLAAGRQSPGIPREVVERFVAHSVNFGVFTGGAMVGYARVVTDYAAFAYLGDVFLLDGHRGRGLGTWLMECVLAHPGLQGLRRWMLMSGPRSVSLYRRFGFTDDNAPGHLMHRTDREIYLRAGRGRGAGQGDGA